MSYQGSEWARKVRNVNRGEKAVLMQLGHELDQRTNVVRISVPALAESAEMSPRQVIRILHQLEAPRQGYPRGILKQIGGGQGKGNVSCYSFVGFVAKGDIRDTQKVTFQHEKVTFATAKGDIRDSVIRKEEIQEENQKQENLSIIICESPDTANRTNDDDAKNIVRSEQIGSLKCRLGYNYQAPSYEIDRVIKHFESSPVTRGKSSRADRATARQLLENFTPDQVEYGILLGSARKSASELNYPAHANRKVENLAYFKNAIEEVALDQTGQYSASYADYLRHCLRTDAHRKKQPQRAVG